MLPRRRLIVAAFALLGTLRATARADAGADQGADLVVSEARVRAPLPGQRNTAAYCAIENRGTASVTIVGARSTAARGIEIHETIRDGDMYRMRRRAEVEIPVRDTVRFEPGGLHLMLFDVGAIGEQVEIELMTHDGRHHKVIFQRTAAGAG